MLNSGKKICTLCDKKINILTLVLSEKKILNETKNHNPPPFKLNGRSLRQLVDMGSKMIFLILVFVGMLSYIIYAKCFKYDAAELIASLKNLMY